MADTPLTRGRLVPESWPIAVKISIDLLLASLIPLIVVVFLTGNRSRAELEKSAQQNVQLLARVTAARLDQLIVDTAHSVKLASLDESVIALCGAGPADPSLRQKVNRKLGNVIATNPDFASIFITDSTGIGLASTNDKNIGMDFNFRDYFKHAIAGEEYVSDILIGKTSHEPGVYFSIPIRTAEQKIIGTVVLKLKGERIWNMVDSVHVGSNGYAMLADANGVVTSHPIKSQLYRSFAPLTAEQVKAIDPEKTFSIDKIQSLDMPELQKPITSNALSDTVRFTTAPSADDSERQSWVAGFSKLQERNWKVLVVQPLRQFQETTRALFKQQLMIALVVAGVATLMALWRARTLVRPVVALKDAATRLATGDFSIRAPQYSHDEVGQLAAAFNSMVPQLQQSVELKKAMEIATTVQQSLLPQKPPKLQGLDVAGKSRYCDAAGGDYFDFADAVEFNGQPNLMVVGDVTGHGIGAALLMCTARAALRSAALTGGDLGQLLTRVNAVLCQNAEHGLFMTMSIMTVDTQAGTIRYACAAHDPIMIYDPQTQEFRELSEGSVPLAAINDMQFEQYSADGLKPGMLLFLGTDGIWEARNNAGEMYGKERLVEVLKTAATRSAQDISAAVEESLRIYLDGRSIQDDVTYIVVKII